MVHLQLNLIYSQHIHTLCDSNFLIIEIMLLTKSVIIIAITNILSKKIDKTFCLIR